MSHRKFILLLSTIMTISAIACALQYLHVINDNDHQSAAKTAEIYVNGTLYKSVNLWEVTDSYTIEVETETPSLSSDGQKYVGIRNTVLIENNGISVIDADCPDKHCVKSGKIYDNTASVVCLPHKLIIKITEGSAENADTTPDAISE